MARFISIMLLYCIAAGLSVAQEPTDTSFVTISGIVKDKDSKKALENVSISVVNSHIGTVSNADGSFSLTIPFDRSKGKIKAEQLGYFSNTLSLQEFTGDGSDITILMSPSVRMLKEVIVRGGRPDQIVAEALKKIPTNYSPDSNLFTAFYRETVQKGKRYIAVSEAVVDVFKTPYARRVNNGERVQIKKGRRLISQNSRDTLSVKIVGGPTLPVIIDFVKNSDFLFGYDDLAFYDFSMEKPVSIDDRMQYVIRFSPKVKLEYALYRGLLYIDQETLSFSKAEFQLDMSDKRKATDAILRKKPRGLHFKPQEIAFTVTYRLTDGISYLNYIKVKTRFKCDWKRRLFSSGYTTYAEMVMVDRIDNPEEGISRKLAFGNNEIFYDKVADYWDADFWNGYNIIEPTESLDKAVMNLKRNNDAIMTLYP